MNKMFLHLFEDEKFVDVIVDQFEAVAPDKSIYLIAVSDTTGEAKFVKSRHPNMVFDVIDGTKMQGLFANLEQFKIVILHNLIHAYKQNLVRNYKHRVHFHWMCWGADLYNATHLDQKLYGRTTKSIQYSGKNLNGKVGVFLQAIFPSLWDQYYLKPKGLPTITDYKDLFKYIRSCSTVIPDEHLIVQKLLNPNIQYIALKYGDLSALVGLGSNEICNGHHFLVGNSASFTSNHFETFDLIKPYCQPGQKVFVPLSYGDENYAVLVQERAIELFGQNAEPLQSFMDIQSYNKVMLGCGNVVMNHYRQQAMGNIIIALYKGARVFLNKKNPVYSYLKGIGIRCFEISEIPNYNSLPTFDELAAHNRPILQSIYGRKQVLKETRAFVDKVRSI